MNAEPTTIGVIGPGAMGLGMVASLVRRGYRVVARDVRPDANARAAAAGAVVLASPAEIARVADAVFVVVVDAGQIDDVLFGRDGVASSGAPDRIVSIASTVDPEYVRALPARCANAGITILDSPISGGPARAHAGTMTVMLAGPAPARERCAKVFAALAGRVFTISDRDGDGFRELPDGKPLVLERWSVPVSTQREADELWTKNMTAIGIRLAIRKDKLPELRKMARLGKIPFRSDGWNADYPDAENFMQLLYGPNAGQENQARFRLPEYDRLYDEARKLPDGPQRTALFGKMQELMVAYAPMRLTQHIVEDHAWHARVLNYRAHPIRTFAFRYYDTAGPSPGR